SPVAKIEVRFCVTFLDFSFLFSLDLFLSSTNLAVLFSKLTFFSSIYKLSDVSEIEAEPRFAYISLSLDKEYISLFLILLWSPWFAGPLLARCWPATGLFGGCSYTSFTS